jgi:sirohydrochlorin cobaltochelatase
MRHSMRATRPHPGPVTRRRAHRPGPLIRHILLALLGLTPALLGAQPDAGRPGATAEAVRSLPVRIGTLLIAHGGEPEWNAEVERIARTAQTGGPLELAYLMGPAAATHRFQDQVARLVAQGATQVVIVPLLVSSHSGHYEQVRYLAGLTDSLDEMMHHHLHMGGLERPRVAVPLHVTAALDDAPELADVLTERATALTRDPTGRALFLVAHGPNSAEDHAAWMTHLRTVAARVRERSGFRDVRVEMVRDDAPAPVRAEAVRRVRELIELQRAVTGQPVTVVPVLVSRGRVSREKFTADLAGLDILYEGTPLLPHPLLARWIERRVTDVVQAPVATAPGMR